MIELLNCDCMEYMATVPDKYFGGCAKLEDDPTDPYFELMTCNKCKHISRWDCRGMLPMLDSNTEDKQNA